MTVTFNSSNTRYVQVKMLNLCTYSIRNARMKELPTRESVRSILRENKIPMLVENGSMCLVPLKGV